MFKFFEMIGEFITTIVDVVIFIINQILNVFELIAKGAVASLAVVNMIPLSLRLIASCFVSYCIIINILGKGS